MSDQGKPRTPGVPTLRPKGLPERRDSPSSPPLGSTAIPDLGDELDALLTDAEEKIGKVESIRAPRKRISQSLRPPDDPPRDLPIIGHFGSYAIVGRLALGGMAEILLAREESEGAGSRYLVVKRILPEYGRDESFVDMFLDEARVMMRLSHPNVCHVYKFGTHDGVHYIAMEWVNGCSLGKVIRAARRSGGIPMPVAEKLIASIAEALDHAHNAVDDRGEAMSIVHRDVTPDNIMISYDGAVKLLDFGIAKAKARSHKTQAGVVKGKFAYMAPEQCRGKELDYRVDIFALGVCLYEALTGKPLYRRETEFETMEAIVRGPVPKLSDRISSPQPELERILAKCLAKRAEDRWESAGELQEALQTHMARRGEVVTARRVKDLMHELFREEMKRGPIVESTPFGSSFHAGSDPNAVFFNGSPSGEMPVFPDDLPELPAEMPGLEGSTTPPYAGPGADPDDNVRPGVEPKSAGAWTGASSPAGAPGFGPRPGSAALPNPTAPARPARNTTRVEPEKSGGVAIALGVIVGLAVLGGIGFAAMQLMAGGEDTIVATQIDRPAAALRGALEMSSDPPGATLFLDDVERGTTPVTVDDLSTGRHAVRLELEGHETHTGSVEIRATQTNRVLQPLTAAADPEAPAAPTVFGRVNVTSTPPARIFLDGEELGRTPLRNLRLPVGVVRLEMETPDGRRVTRGVLVREGETSSTHLDL